MASISFAWRKGHKLPVICYLKTVTKKNHFDIYIYLTDYYDQNCSFCESIWLCTVHLETYSFRGLLHEECETKGRDFGEQTVLWELHFSWLKHTSMKKFISMPCLVSLSLFQEGVKEKWNPPSPCVFCWLVCILLPSVISALATTINRTILKEHITGVAVLIGKEFFQIKTKLLSK